MVVIASGRISSVMAWQPRNANLYLGLGLGLGLGLEG